MQSNTLIPKPKQGTRLIKITVAELSLLLQKIDGSQATFFSMITTTDARLKKTGNPYKDEKVEKVSGYQGSINVNYTKAVNNQREREGLEADFQATQNWHEKKYDEYNGCVVVKVEGNKRQEYLMFIKQKVKRYGFYLNGAKSTTEQAETFKAFLPTHSPAKNQGLVKTVDVQTIKLENIKRITINKKTYEIA